MRAWLWLSLGVLAAVSAAVLLFVTLLPEPAPLDLATELDLPEPARTRPTPPEARPPSPPAPPREPPPEPAGTPPPREEPPPADPAREVVPLDAAKEALDRLRALLKSRRSRNEEILTALDEVWGWYRDPRDPASVTLHAMPRMGSPDARTVAEANLRLLLEPVDVLSLPDEVQRFWRELEKFRRDVEKAFLEAFTLVKVNPETHRNLREDVNVAAVLYLGWMEGPEISRRIRRSLEKKVFKAKHEVGMELYRASFEALARLNDMRSFDWMREEFTHAKTKPRANVDQLVAAHEGILHFRDVPGKRRYELVLEMVKTYSGVEAAAETEPSEAFWDRVGPGVLRVVEHYADRPRDGRGHKIRTMHGFQEWFRDHKNPRRPPWTD